MPHEHENQRLKFILRPLYSEEDKGKWAYVVNRLHELGFDVGNADGMTILVIYKENPINEISEAKALIFPFLDNSYPQPVNNAVSDSVEQEEKQEEEKHEAEQIVEEEENNEQHEQ